MKKILSLFILLTASLVLLSGCNLFVPKQAATPAETEITYYQPTEKTDKFCNGADMDSEGFRKTITYETKATIPMANLSRNELIKQTLIYAADKSGFSISNTVTVDYLKIIDDTAYIQPIEGWAGVSIFLCYWKPYMEVNLLQFPEIKKVEWVTDNAKWLELIEK
jgi:hypothetical protein